MFTIIPEGYFALRESFGQFSKVLNPGIHLWIPFIYTFKTLKNWNNQSSERSFLIEKAEQTSQAILRHAQTKDFIPLNTVGLVRWKVIDPKQAVYSIHALPDAIHKVALATLREVIAETSLEEIFSKRQSFNHKVETNLKPTLKSWGVEIIQFDLLELIYSKEVEKTLQKRTFSQLQLKKKSSSLSAAKAEAEAILILSEAKAKAKEIEALAYVNYLQSIQNEEEAYLKNLQNHVYADQAVRLLESHLSSSASSRT